MMTWLPTFVTVVAFVFGLIIGSFLNVVIWRVPRGESIVSPPSACPHCGKPIRPYDNIPMVSWLVLRGKCRDCGGPISTRYPLVELGTGLAFAFVVIAGFFGIYPLALVPTLVYFAAISIALALIDIDTRRLPNAIVLPSYLVVGALLVLASALTGSWGAMIAALIGGTILFVIYFVMLLIYPRGMGFGDVKLAGVIGLLLGWLGWGPLAVGAFAAFLLGGLFGIVLVIARRVGRKSGIPFGPWMLLGAWVGVFAGQVVSQAYLALIGLA